jgi:hypothetical protein
VTHARRLAFIPVSVLGAVVVAAAAAAAGCADGGDASVDDSVVETYLAGATALF